MLDTLIIIGAGVTVIGACALGFLVLTAPRIEDWDDPEDALGADAFIHTAYGSDRYLLGGSESGGRAHYQPLLSEGAPVRSIDCSPHRGQQARRERARQVRR